MRICMVGDSQDLSCTYMSWLAQKRDIEVVTLDEDALGVHWSFTYADLNPGMGVIERGGKCYPYSSFCGAFVRLHPEPGLPGDLSLPAEEASALVVERRYAMQHFLNSLPFPVANRPFSGRSNGSKPHQMNLLAQAGFTVPRWIVSNETAAVAEFARQCPEGVIYKSCSGLRSKVRLLDKEFLNRLQEGTSPVVVQKYISGYDVRIHVVKHQIFATKISSHGIDYRFESDDNQFQETAVPQQIQTLCINFAEAESLTIAGFDFRVTDQGEWYCLEVNPVPTFLPYEMTTGQAIGKAILDLFVSQANVALAM